METLTTSANENPGEKVIRYMCLAKLFLAKFDISDYYHIAMDKLLEALFGLFDGAWFPSR